MKKKNTQKTSWDHVAGWYDQIVSKEGHYYHKEVILPYLSEKIIKNLKPVDSVLDIACGQGILERQIPKEIRYLGLDISKNLIQEAKKLTVSPKHEFKVQDATTAFDFNEKFSTSFVVLAFQNLKDPKACLLNAANHLKDHGTLVLVLNHPCYRIPRQSSWMEDPGKKLQFRRVDTYMSSLEIPISMQPSKGEKADTTFSYHHSLSSLSKLFVETNFHIKEIEELISNKESTGGAAKMENRARKEFPLFMVLILEKIPQKLLA